MANKIKPRRSYTASSVPLSSDLDTHELAINWVDGKAFTKDASGNIVTITLGGGSYTLPTASASALGGVKVGSGLVISNGVLATDDTRWSYFLPAAPTGVTATAGNASATVSWTAPAVVAPPVTDYTIQYSSNSGSSWSTFSHSASTATTATVTGLINDTSYVFRVAAVNGIGTGAYSTASSSIVAGSDPYFSQVALLLHMDGTGSTFTDSSGTPKTVTANGNATQSATQSKWGGKSAYFTGTSRISASTSSAFSFGTGDFCIEMWVYPSGENSYQTLFSTRSSSTSQDSANVFVGFNSGTLTPIVYTNGLILSGSSALSAGVWSHIAFARASGTISIYLNGTRIGNTSFTNSINGTNASVGLTENNEHQFAGYIDDVRITKGNSRYTGSTITVPTAAFPDS